MFTRLYLAWLAFKQRAQEVEKSSIGEVALTVAKTELGQGETEENNRGEAVTRYRGGIDSAGSWCAAFVGWCVERACKILSIDPIIPTPRTFGAKKLFRQLARVGKLISVEQVQPGDIVCLHRGKTKADAWKGHLFLVEQKHEDAGGVVDTIEANVGAFPSLVKRMTRDLTAERVLGIVRLPDGPKPIVRVVP